MMFDRGSILSCTKCLQTLSLYRILWGRFSGLIENQSKSDPTRPSSRETIEGRTETMEKHGGRQIDDDAKAWTLLMHKRIFVKECVR